MASGTSTGDVSLAINALSVDLFRILATQKDGNVFFSPVSISTCMGMLLLGTKTDSETELFKGLNFDKAFANPSQVHPSFKKLLDENFKEDAKLPYSLYLANRLLVETLGEPAALENYKNNLVAHYKGEISDVNFGKDGAVIMKDVNSWVSEKTKGMIKTLLEDAPGAQTKAIILNAVYFKGSWLSKFDAKQTKPGDFLNNGKNASKVSFMHLCKEFNYSENKIADLNVQVIELPYAGNVSMYIVLPQQKDGLALLTPKLTNAELERVSNQLFLESEVHIAIPKFKFESKFVLNKALESLGIKKVFTREADLSGINGQKNLFVSEVLHKAVVDVNEEGTEAAAATSVGIMLTSMPMQRKFVADHPFLFFIKDKNTGIILFIGKVDTL